MKMTRLIPMLPVKSMPASVDFYCRILGFEVEKRNDEWGWTMLRFDECRLMVDQSINAHPSNFRDSVQPAVKKRHLGLDIYSQTV